MNRTIGFIGAGQMARALAKGFVDAGQAAVQLITACDPVEDARKRFLAAVPGAVVQVEAKQVVANSEIVFLAVKPQHMDSVFGQVESSDNSKCLFVSIVAGVTLAKLTEGFRANEILRKASAYFAQAELDRRPRGW